MLKPSRGSEPHESLYYAKKETKTQHMKAVPLKRRRSLSRPIRKTAALVGAGVSAGLLSRLPTRSRLDGIWTDGCPYCGGNRTTNLDGIRAWTEKVRAELLPSLGWNQGLPEPFGYRMKHIADTLHLPPLLLEPSPPLILGASVAFAFAVTYIRHLNKTDRYQDHIIGGGILATIAVAWVSDKDLVRMIRFLPWAIILTLVLSSLAHRVSSLRRSGSKLDNSQVDRREESVEWPKWETKRAAAAFAGMP